VGSDTDDILAQLLGHRAAEANAAKDEIVAGLRELRKGLMAQVQAIDGCLSLLGVLPSGGARVPGARKGATYDLLRRHNAEHHQVGEEYGIGCALDWMCEHGWQTSAADKRAAAAMALAKEGRTPGSAVRWVRQGVYQRVS
jgi:hypothetical protein